MTFLPNPNYGKGIFRRRIRLTQADSTVSAELEDNFHAFRLHLAHDGQRITAIDSEAIRYPVSFCPQARDALEAFVGISLSDASDRRVLREVVQSGLQCTHLHDLSWLSAAMALRDDSQRVYDIEIPDAQDNRRQATLWRDGVEIFHWLLEDDAIVAPDDIAGNSPFQGFGRWASGAYQGDTLEAAYVMQICLFVSLARRYDLVKMEGLPNITIKIKPGTCFTYQAERIGQGKRTAGMIRDFTDSAEQLLQFR